jgi:hypothetical protein
VGVTTVADDEGWLRWNLAEIGAALYPYTPPGRRDRGVEKRAARLVDAGLLVIHDCGCAFVPTLKRDHATKSGNQSSAVWAWHSRHRSSQPGPIRTDPSESVSSSSSASSSSSDADADAGSSRARGALPPRVLQALSRGSHLRAVDDFLDDKLTSRALEFLAGLQLREDLLIEYIRLAWRSGRTGQNAVLMAALDEAERAS